MMRTRFFIPWILCGLALITLPSCTTYYRVTDPASGRSYYTTRVSEAGNTGAVKIKDAKTGGTITLQSSEVHEISDQEFKAGVSERPQAPK
jgi:hypothetical protein